MLRLYQQNFKRLRWCSSDETDLTHLPKDLVTLAVLQGSLTSALTEKADGDFSVNVLSQTIAYPLNDEQTVLGRSKDKTAMIREVELVAKNTAVVYARSIIPLTLVTNDQQGLANLGATPLGHLLFQEGQSQDTDRELACYSFDGREMVARRTPYFYRHKCILVSEMFLPAVLDF